MPGPSSQTQTVNTSPPDLLKHPLGRIVGGSESRLDQTIGRPGSSNAIPNAGFDLITDTLRGNYLSPESNPYLQQTFNQAADLTRGRLDSEFAGSGRNLGASFPARSQELQYLSNSIFGGNYQRERDRQLNTLGQGLQYDPMNLYINRIAGVIPGAGGSTQATQPVHRDVLGSLAGLGLAGAGIFGGF